MKYIIGKIDKTIEASVLTLVGVFLLTFTMSVSGQSKNIAGKKMDKAIK